MMLDGSTEVQLADCVARQKSNEQRIIDLEAFSDGAKRIFQVNILSDFESLSEEQKHQCDTALRAIEILNQKKQEN